MTGNGLGLGWEDGLVAELLGQSEEQVHGLGRYGVVRIPDALLGEEPTHCGCQELSTIFEILSIADDCLQEKICRQVAIILEEVTAQELLDKSTVLIIRRVFVSLLPRYALV